jgi:hypothetical protein
MNPIQSRFYSIILGQILVSILLVSLCYINLDGFMTGFLGAYKSVGFLDQYNIGKEIP